MNIFKKLSFFIFALGIGVFAYAQTSFDPSLLNSTSLDGLTTEEAQRLIQEIQNTQSTSTGTTGDTTTTSVDTTKTSTDTNSTNEERATTATDTTTTTTNTDTSQVSTVGDSGSGATRTPLETVSNNVVTEINSVTTKNTIETKDASEKTSITKPAEEKVAQEDPLSGESSTRVLQDRDRSLIDVDSDGDGVVDYDETHIYKTDPQKSDTDGDRKSDGQELLEMTNPLSGDELEKIVYENPQDVGTEDTELLLVSSVSLEGVAGGQATATSSIENTGPTPLVIKGKGPENSFVYIYVFSTPILITTKTDENGNWVYTLDQELEDGSHEVYVAVVDGKGKILAKSAPFSFVKELGVVKEAQALTINDVLPIPEDQTPNFLASPYAYVVIFAVFILIGIIFVFIGARARRRKELDNLIT